MPAPTRASHLDDMVFVLFFFVCCGVQYQCQCRMFYLYLVYNTCILYIYITKCMYNQFFFHHFHPVPQLFPINFLGMVTWRSSSASVERERPHCVLTHRWRIFRENDPQGFRFRGQFAWILCAPCFFSTVYVFWRFPEIRVIPISSWKERLKHCTSCWQFWVTYPLGAYFV